MNELEMLRAEIDDADTQISALFDRRMALVKKVAVYKKEHGVQVLNTARETEILRRLTDGKLQFDAEYTKRLFTEIFDISRDCQIRFTDGG
jgi:monofunctional chorismate mutase